jgi:hypothetical protein
LLKVRASHFQVKAGAMLVARNGVTVRPLTELELTPAQQKEIRPLLPQHQQEIKTLFDKNPSAPREALSRQIHGISDQTHHRIDALLTDHRKQLAEAMQARMHNSEKRPPS